MNFQNKVVIVAGGANGIGRALCRRFAAEGAHGIVVADLDGEGATRGSVPGCYWVKMEKGRVF